MRTRWTGIATTATLAVLASGAQAAENGLLGIRLFDPAVKVVQMYGTPDQIQAVVVGGMQGGGAPGGGGMGAPAGGPPMGGRGGFGPGPNPASFGGGAPGGAAAAPGFSFGDYILRQKGGPDGGMGDLGLQSAPPGVGGGPAAPGGGTGGRAPAAGGGSAENATYTRWVYNRSGSKYGFIVDKQGRVVQIEAIGLSNPKVRTKKGVTFGATFAEVVKKYSTPDGYDISGDNVLARFLNREKVAFRFARLGPNKPQVVTGIVVAAGKG